MTFTERIKAALDVLLGEYDSVVTETEDALRVELAKMTEDRDNLLRVIEQKIDAEFAVFEKQLTGEADACGTPAPVKPDDGPIEAPSVENQYLPQTPEDDPSRQ